MTLSASDVIVAAALQRHSVEQVRVRTLLQVYLLNREGRERDRVIGAVVVLVTLRGMREHGRSVVLTTVRDCWRRRCGGSGGGGGGGISCEP